MAVRSPPESYSVEALLEHASWLEALARSLVHDDDAASDLVQETWVAAMQNPPRSRDPIVVKAWFRTVFVRRMRAAFVRQVRRRDREDEVASTKTAGASAQEVSQRLELHRALIDSIEELTAGERQILTMRYFEGLPPREIARRLGLTNGVVRTRLCRALGNVRARLDRRFGKREAWAAPFLLHFGVDPVRPRLRWSLPLASAAVIGVVWSLAFGGSRSTGIGEVAATATGATEVSASDTTTEGGPPSQRVDARAPESVDVHSIRVVDATTGTALVGVRASLARVVTREQVRTTEKGHLLGAGRPAPEEYLRWLFRVDKLPAFQRDESSELARTDEHGCVSLASHHRGHLLLEHVDHVTTAVALRGGELPGEVAMPRTGDLQLRIVGVQGHARPGLRVRVAMRSPGQRRHYLFEDLPNGLGHGPTDQQGLIRIAGLPCGVPLVVSARGFVAPTVTTVIDPQVRFRRVSMIAGGQGSIRGSLAGSIRGRCRIEYRPHGTDDEPSYWTMLRANGKFSLRQLPIGEGTLRIVEELPDNLFTSCVRKRLTVQIDDARTVDVGAIGLDPVVRVRGNLAGWSPARGLRLGDLVVEDGAGKEQARTRVRSDGEFELEAPPGHWFVALRQAGVTLLRAAVTLPVDRLSLDASGDSATLLASLPRNSGAMNMTACSFTAGGQLASIDRVGGPEGVRLVRSAGLAAVLFVTDDSTRAWYPDIDPLEPGASLDLGELAIGSGRVVGTIDGPGPFRDVTLRSMLPPIVEDEVHRVAVSSTGTFDIDEVRAGRWQLCFADDDGAACAKIVDVRADETTKVALSGGAGCRCEVQLGTEDGPLGGQAVEILPAAGDAVTLVSDGQGVAVGRRLPPGPAQVRFRHGGTEVRMPVVLSPRATTAVHWARGSTRERSEDDPVVTTGHRVVHHMLRHPTMPGGTQVGGWIGSDRSLDLGIAAGRSICALWQASAVAKAARQVLMLRDFDQQTWYRCEGRLVIEMADAQCVPERISIVSVHGSAIGLDVPFEPHVRGGIVVEGIPGDSVVEIAGFVPGLGNVTRRVRTNAAGRADARWPAHEIR